MKATTNRTMAPFPDDTRYAAIGDSITHNGWYAPYVDLYYLTRFPKQRLEIFNCGINGDTVTGGEKRYDWDIAPHHPTVASIMFGMNDVGRELYEAHRTGPELAQQRKQHIDDYEIHLRKLVALLQRDKAQVILILPTIFDNTVVAKAAHYPGVNEAIGECANRAVAVAGDLGCDVVDFYHPMLQVTLEHQKTKPDFSMISGDRTHPTMLGHLFMAYLFLKAQNVPSTVARVSIRATDGSVKHADNCQIDEIKTGPNTLTFRYWANSLPFPIEWWTSQATTWAPFVEDLDQEMLQITGLTDGTYRLAIDDKPIRTYTAGELSAGVNLAIENKTPQARQAQSVWVAYRKRQEIVFKFRTIASVERAAFEPDFPRSATLEQMKPLLDAYLKRIAGNPWEKAITGEVDAYRACKPHEDEMRSQLTSMLTEVRALAQPKPHVVKISPATVTRGSTAPAGDH
jgi:lysophospholipase L1-like esterase